ncbi:MAG: hypothetical protein RL757_3073 [Bacteroidota bacterium]|jgi:hypothetical protein
MAKEKIIKLLIEDYSKYSQSETKNVAESAAGNMPLTPDFNLLTPKIKVLKDLLMDEVPFREALQTRSKQAYAQYRVWTQKTQVLLHEIASEANKIVANSVDLARLSGLPMVKQGGDEKKTLEMPSKITYDYDESTNTVKVAWVRVNGARFYEGRWKHRKDEKYNQISTELPQFTIQLEESDDVRVGIELQCVGKENMKSGWTPPHYI